MKKLIPTLLFITISIIAIGQTDLKEIQIDYWGRYPSKKYDLFEKINNNEFLILQNQRKTDDKLAKYDQSLNKIFEISVPSKNYYPSIKYRKKSKDILFVILDKLKKKYSCEAKLYDSNNGELLESKILCNNQESYIRTRFSKNNEYLLLLQFPGKKKNKKTKISIFSGKALEQASSFELTSDKTESLDKVYINDQGKIIIAYKFSDKYLFELYNLTGQLINTIEHKTNLESNESYNGRIYTELKNGRFLFTCSKFRNKELNAIDIYDVDFEGNKVKRISSKEFTKEYFKTLRDKVVEKDLVVMMKSHSRGTAKKLRYFHLEDVIVDENENIYVKIQSRFVESTYEKDGKEKNTMAPMELSSLLLIPLVKTYGIR